MFWKCFAVFMMSFSVFGAHSHAQTVNLQEQNTMSVLWFQKTGEAKALYYQGYNIGKMRLDGLLAERPKNPAVVLDIDETILDNSPMFATHVVTGKIYPSWSDWVKMAIAKPLPGALEFLKYADSKGVAIYYISNRSENQKAATMLNLQNVGAPQVNAEHVLLRQPNEKGKEARRNLVAKSHNILLLFGDNLGDFSGFDGLTVADRMQAVDEKKEEFGRKLIVFPNPMYGDWEGAIYNYDRWKTAAEKEKLRKKNLEPMR